MWPDLGPIKMWTVLYGVSIVSFFVVSYFITQRLRLRRLAWHVLSTCYLLGMTVGAKALYDIQHDEFSVGALFRLDHYTTGGCGAVFWRIWYFPYR